MSSATETTINALDIMEENRDKLSLSEMKTLIHCNHPYLDLETYDYDKIEKILILSSWLGEEDNIDTKHPFLQQDHDILDIRVLLQLHAESD